MTTKNEIIEAESWAEKGENFFKTKNFSNALGAFNNAIMLYDKNSLYFYKNGNCYFELDNLKAAMDDYNQCKN